MSQKPIREYSGKRLIANWFSKHATGIPEAFKTISSMLLVTPTTDLGHVESPFPSEARLVAKPDQLLKRRGKLGLVKLNATWGDARDWIAATRSRKVTVDNATDELNYFLVEPFIPHKSEEEHYLCIRSIREGDEILFYHKGGIDVGDVEDKASRLVVPVGDSISRSQVTRTLLANIDDNQKQDMISEFIEKIFDMYAELHFCYLEINPLVVLNDLSGVYILDLAAKLDSAAEFQCHSKWSDVVEFPPFFGHHSTPEEKFVQELDERTGASLKLTILNPAARVWTLVAGGGASVIYADTVADLGFADELGNYGEYSGAPTQELTYQYANTLLRCMLKHPRKEGKILLIGGGIANFTDVAETFTGVIQALEENKEEMISQKTKIYVRRGGPNYQRGLKLMKECADKTGLDMQVFGPETHITAIVSMALLTKDTDSSSEKKDEKTELQDLNVEGRIESLDLSQFKWNDKWEEVPDKNDRYYVMSEKTKAIVYGMQVGAVQNMLDFDYISRRDTPSVAAIVYDFSSGMHHRQFYWGHKEVMIPVFKDLKDALSRYKDVDTIVNFASSRSAYQATLEMLNFSQIKHITIIAEGVPERHTRHLIRKSKETKTIILGPSTVGGIKPGAFRIGNTGGMLDNIVASKLHRPGSVAFVSKSGGLSNELANIISRCTNGVIEGMAIGGDRHPITTFMDNLIQYQRDPRCKILVVLGEVGGVLEYEVAEAVEKKIITKPVIAWCTGTCTRCFKHDVQFGHAGAMAQSTIETAMAKNFALAKAGCLVPESFDDFARLIKFLYQRLVKEKILNEADYKEVEPPPIPVDYSWARKLGLVRKPAGFLSSISDDRGEELVYAGMPISQVFSQDLGIGGVVGLLWFRRRLPDYANTFIEMILMVTADHGPAVSGAHNTIVTARAGKDLISSLCSGLLTIGPRFGGALDDAAKMFTRAYDSGLTAEEFVEKTRKSGKLISGIGHLVKSLENPDKRVEIVVDFAKKNFDSTCVLDYALQVQKVTTRKKSNLILNVDGAVACAFVDLLRGCKLFSREEADQYVKLGSLNALFVLGRSIGFIGHFLDQKRLGQGLYRHPTDDITYFLHDLPSY